MAKSNDRAAIDVETLKTIMVFMKPEHAAPMSPAASLHTSVIDERISMAKDISYMQVDIREIKGSLKEIAENHISKSEFNEHITTDNIAHVAVNKNLDDHEARVRALEVSMWKLAGMSSFGSAVLTMAFAYVMKLMN